MEDSVCVVKFHAWNGRSRRSSWHLEILFPKNCHQLRIWLLNADSRWAERAGLLWIARAKCMRFAALATRICAIRFLASLTVAGTRVSPVRGGRKWQASLILPTLPSMLLPLCLFSLLLTSYVNPSPSPALVSLIIAEIIYPALSSCSHRRWTSY